MRAVNLAANVYGNERSIVDLIRTNTLTNVFFCTVFVLVDDTSNPNHSWSRYCFDLHYVSQFLSAETNIHCVDSVEQKNIGM